MKIKTEITSDCLSASLTLLVKHNILTHQEIMSSLTSKSFEGLFDLLNETYKKEVKSL